MQASSAINKFLENFHYKLTADMIKAMNNMGLDIRSVVNIASLIEKEAANDDERRTIASVIYNRLGSYAPLGIDASILYLHPDHEGAPTGTMLEEDTPYNTRIYQGLPDRRLWSHSHALSRGYGGIPLQSEVVCGLQRHHVASDACRSRRKYVHPRQHVHSACDKRS